jgi:ABC-type multidrug transport system permease subunit
MTQFLNGTYAVLYRELLLLKSKLFRFGYVFYSLFSPIIYLAAFGLGLGSRIDVGAGGYTTFLLQGIVCMSSMNNSYNLVMTSVSIGRLHSGSFQTIVSSPVGSASVMAGLVLSGIVRGFVAVFFIMAAGFLMFGAFPFDWLSVTALVLNMCFFSSLGVIIGLKLQDMETNALIANFVIMPMAFFSGTFYPVDYLPEPVRAAVYLLPLSHTNLLMRADSLSGDAVLSFVILSVLCAVSAVIGWIMLRRYSE